MRNNNFVPEIGMRFGTRVLMEQVRTSDRIRRTHWKWLCDCGNIGMTQLLNIKRSKHCPKCHRKKSKNRKVQSLSPGDTLGLRTLVEEITHKGTFKTRRWSWICTCGNEGVSSINYLMHTKSLKCKKCSKDHYKKFRKFTEGSILGKRTLLKELDITGECSTRRWSWVCSCGRTGVTKLQSLCVSDRCPSCGHRKWKEKVWAKSGDRFGSRILIKEVGSSEVASRTRTWSWKCDCGEVGELPLNFIMKSKQCRSCFDTFRNDRPQSGYRYGNRVLDKLVEDNKIQSLQKWSWVCDCGVVGVCRIGSLRATEQCPSCNANRSLLRVKEGDRFGFRVLVSEIDKEGRLERRRWSWVCDCGNKGTCQLQVLVRTENCRNCMNMRKGIGSKVFSGQRIGNRVLVEEVKKHRIPLSSTWSWLCDCGRRGTTKVGSMFTRPMCISCKMREKISILPQGTVRGVLEVIEYVGVIRDGKGRTYSHYRVKCLRCASVTVVPTFSLNGRKSCKECQFKINLLGKYLSIDELSEIFGISRTTIMNRRKDKRVGKLDSILKEYKGKAK